MANGGYKIRNPNGIYFITFSVVDWIDVFTRNCYSDIVIDSLKYCQSQKGLIIYAWVIMSNHVHFIFASKQGVELGNILRDFKKYTSVRIMREIEYTQVESRREWMIDMFRRHGQVNPRNEFKQFWQQYNHPIELLSNRMKYQRLNYLHQNPVKAGIVDKPEYYIYSSARSYSGIPGLVDVKLLV